MRYKLFSSPYTEQSQVPIDGRSLGHPFFVLPLVVPLQVGATSRKRVEVVSTAAAQTEAHINEARVLAEKTASRKCSNNANAH